MTDEIVIDPNSIDDWVDEAVLEFVNPDHPKSFFLFAGAGSGKTRTLVNVLKSFREKYGEYFRLQRKKIAIITYTNAAADEIIHRLDYDPIFHVSTIHSFAWGLVKTFTNDIRDWIHDDLKIDIEDPSAEQEKSRKKDSAAYVNRQHRLVSKQKRLNALQNIRKFTYNPNGDNVTTDSLNHTQVLNLLATFILEKPLMQRLIYLQFPVLLIDESQDTNKQIVDAVFALQQKFSGMLSVGFFGDTMQRIYTDGKENLQKIVPPNWETPHKKMNHRSAKRIVKLINNIRKGVDGIEQQARLERPDGFVRMFICPRGVDKAETEVAIIKKMQDITGDELWNQDIDNVKVLILEHHMAAKRMGFEGFFEPLYNQESFRTGILQGNLPGLSFLMKTLVPLYRAHNRGDNYEITRIVRQESPLLSAEIMKKSRNQVEVLNKCKDAVNDFFRLWEGNIDPSIQTVLRKIQHSGLFVLPEPLNLTIASPVVNINSEVEAESHSDKESEAWKQACEQPFSQVEKYTEYLSEHARFGTHQGVKGLEYSRVIVIADDEESKGFMFSYDKLFGVKELTDQDRKNIAEGKETGQDRTKRLFYVACSRAKESLAIVAYTNDPALLKKNVLQLDWLESTEVIEI